LFLIKDGRKSEAGNFDVQLVVRNFLFRLRSSSPQAATDRYVVTQVGKLECGSTTCFTIEFWLVVKRPIMFVWVGV